MTKDSVDFIRQGAFISLGMIPVEPEKHHQRHSTASTHAKYTKVISDKHEDPMAQFGAAVGKGHIDAFTRVKQGNVLDTHYYSRHLVLLFLFIQVSVSAYILRSGPQFNDNVHLLHITTIADI